MNLSEAEFRAWMRERSKSTQARNPELVNPGSIDAAASALSRDPTTVLEMQNALAVGMRPTTDEAKLNKTEARYLAWLRSQGDLWIGVQCIVLKCGHDVRYTPDFWALDHQGLRAIDTKGPQVWEDSLIKMRCAARMYPWIRFVLAQEQGLVWVHKDFKP